MDDPAGMRCVERPGGLPEPAERARRMEGASSKPFVHGPALEVLHDDERAAVVLPDVEDGDDVPLTGELRRGERLPLEPRAHVLVSRMALGEHLHGHDATEHRVGRAVDLAHPSARDA